jgi:hypothetical protein
MDSKMTHAARAELASRIRRRYQSATNKQKRKILDEFIAVTGYHPKAAIRVLNTEPLPRRRQTRVRPSLYGEAARTAVIVMWEASDRVCGKRLRALLPILVSALERHGHLKLDDAIRTKILAMSASTIDRLLRMPRSTLRPRKNRRVVPELRRRVRIRTFTEWNEPPPGSMEMDLVAHCGEVNRGSYINSLVLTNIATGGTECAPLIVREIGLLVETLERVRISLPFTLRALDVDNGSEFLNETLFDYCLRHGIEFTRSRPYRKNDQAWDRAEKRRRRAQTSGVSPLRRHRRGASTDAAIWRLTTVYEFLPALFQISRETQAGRTSYETIPCAANTVRTSTAGRMHP